MRGIWERKREGEGAGVKLIILYPQESSTALYRTVGKYQEGPPTGWGGGGGGGGGGNECVLCQ